jgi:hypothetical protein
MSHLDLSLSLPFSLRICFFLSFLYQSVVVVVVLYHFTFAKGKEGGGWNETAYGKKETRSFSFASAQTTKERKKDSEIPEDRREGEHSNNKEEKGVDGGCCFFSIFLFSLHSIASFFLFSCLLPFSWTPFSLSFQHSTFISP